MLESYSAREGQCRQGSLEVLADYFDGANPVMNA
jgi:hypothetical protein